MCYDVLGMLCCAVLPELTCCCADLAYALLVGPVGQGDVQCCIVLHDTAATPVVEAALLMIAVNHCRIVRAALCT